MRDLRLEAQFLSCLGASWRFSAFTQGQAFSALVFLYRAGLKRELSGLHDFVLAKQPVRLVTAVSIFPARWRRSIRGLAGNGAGQWVFPATRPNVQRLTRRSRRHDLHETVIQRAFKDAVRSAGVSTAT